MTKRPHNRKMWEYLESVGVLENGTGEQIKQAKKNYRKRYLYQYKKKQRTDNADISILLSKKNGEYERVKGEAQRHGLCVSVFLKESALAYLNNSFVVPNREQIAELEQLLSRCLNEIQTIYRSKGKWWDRDWKYEAVEKRIEKMEAEMNNFFRNPPLLENQIKEAIQRNPFIKEKLITLISPNKPGVVPSNDSKNKIA